MRRLALATLALATCLTLAPTLCWATGDPLEPVNRRIHGFNKLAQAHVLTPAARAYTAWTPASVRAGVARAFANLAEPVTAASALMAGETEIAASAALRFAINTTLGLGGVRDAAEAMGYRHRPMAVADALCRWGVPSGPYLVLPLLGPSSLRDAAGMVATSFALSQVAGAEAMVAWSAGASWVDYAELAPAVAGVEARALDSYATWRSLYRQRRSAVCEADRNDEAHQYDD